VDGAVLGAGLEDGPAVGVVLLIGGVVRVAVGGLLLDGVSVTVSSGAGASGLSPPGEPPPIRPMVVPEPPETARPVTASKPVIAKMPMTKAAMLVATASVHRFFHHGRLGPV
jgi:hypothetical protein